MAAGFNPSDFEIPESLFEQEAPSADDPSRVSSVQAPDLESLLVNREHARDDHDVPVETTEQEQATAPSTPGAEADSPSAEPASADSAETEAPAEAEAEGATDEAETEPTGPQMVAELAAEYEVEPSEFLEALHIEGHDGQPVPLSDIVEGYQQGFQRVQQQMEANESQMTEARQVFAQERDTVLSELYQERERLRTLVEFDGAPPQALRDENPEAWAEATARAQERRNALEDTNRRLQEESRAAEQAHTENLRRFGQQQKELLLQRHPEWRRDPMALARELSMVDRYLREMGFTDAELRNPLDHRQIEIARDAARYRAASRKAPAARKRLSKLTPVVGGTQRSQDATTGRNTNRAKEAAARLRRSGSDEAAVDFLLNP